MVEREPLLGEGAGGFERRWMQERGAPNNARDAHNLYLETLAELGPIGLALLLVALIAPLAALRRAPEAGDGEYFLYYRESPAFDALRSDPEFVAIYRR